MKLAGVLLIAVIGWAQPAFEVATVRPSSPGSSGVSMSPPGAATFTVRNVTLELLISIAFGVDSDRISAKQGWVSTDDWDVTAKPEGDRALTKKELEPLLQQLLIERFKLKVHKETKLVPGYTLTVAKGGPKLKPTAGAAARPAILPGGIRADNISVATLAALLRRPLGRPVVDETGLAGNYDITLDYAPLGDADSALPSAITAVQETLGLKLVPRKVPVETLVVDYAEKIIAQTP